MGFPRPPSLSARAGAGRSSRSTALADAAGVHLLRFAVMFVVLEIAAVAGVTGWYLGLVANVAVTVLAVVLMSRRRLWTSTGMLTAWRSWAALLALLPLALEALSWALPAGLQVQAPGYVLWTCTLLLVGVNEELISRGVVLSRLQGAFRPAGAVALTAALFGLQHLSAFALTSRQAGDILGNVALSAIAGFALAAFQFRFRWLWPLILVHATADFTVILAARPLPDLYVGVAHVGLLVFGIAMLRWPARDGDGSTAAPPSTAQAPDVVPRPRASDWRRRGSTTS